ncbi:glycoside hydrolase family 28 protein [Runella sp.]|uniref:glycoside hydrolase family 28 protein n=1 Tax=Runella sp. TaxID=1960881 RepID=UPI003D10D059
MHKYFFLFIICLQLPLYAQDSVFFNVKNYGAKGDGHTLDTKAIQKAVDVCAAKGGGTVFFPKGQYITATVFLQDNITLDISGGATILGDTAIKNYPVITPKIPYYSSENIHFSLFYAEGKKNIALKGNGTIDGRGSHFKDTSPFFPKNYNARPFLFWFVQVKNLSVKDLRLQNSGFWMQHYLNCEDVLIDGINVFNHSNKNNDMMDIDGCKNVRIVNCVGDSDDDGITLKSMNEYPVENVVISNCIVSSHCNAIKCGTESSGGFKNITITNCIVKPSVVSDKAIYGNPQGNSGITLASVDGGQLEGVMIDNIRISGPQTPIFLRLGNRARPYKKEQGIVPVGTLRNVQISNISATGASKLGCLLAGLPGHELENIHLSNISITFSGGGTIEDAQKKLPENEKKYPDAEQFGINNAYGFQIRHARNFSLQNVRLYYSNPEDRPAIVLDDVDNTCIAGVSATVSAQSEAFINVRGSKAVKIADCTPLLQAPGKAFLKFEAIAETDIVLSGNDLRDFSKIIEAKNESVNKVVLVGNVEK